ncbi:hypothetical protein GH714_040084 [Hevea brasiliensis]|uniref:Uncharacterized protein n=1 Tax=Hevea brasiliensis TaxID=3981 RepID=A0A6A6MSP4_HEVBR|nr:hypothetical protein GH714_040084 [Hevea brasiliensis]
MCMKKWADKMRRLQEFQEGDLVLVKLYEHGKGAKSQHQGLLRRYERPYPIVKWVGKQAYRVDLPLSLKMRHVFHVSMLEPLVEYRKYPTKVFSIKAPKYIHTQYSKKVKEIVSDPVVHHGHKALTQELLVKWKGLPNSEVNWKSLEDLWQFKDQIAIYEDSKVSRALLEWVSRPKAGILQQGCDALDARMPSPSTIMALLKHFMS